MKVIIVDNYDSFTYNLAHYVRNEGFAVDVHRNDQITLEELEVYDKIILSPGPGLPRDTENLMAIIGRYHQHKAILGVCLGMQAIGEYFGGTLYNLQHVRHGVTTRVKHHSNSSLFEDIPTAFEAGLYHSWAVQLPLPEVLNLTATGEDQVAMALEHQKFKVYGVQFHPESILTEHGQRLIANFLAL